MEEEHDTASSVLSPAPESGLDAIDHTEPFQDSISVCNADPSLKSPTASRKQDAEVRSCFALASGT